MSTNFCFLDLVQSPCFMQDMSPLWKNVNRTKRHVSALVTKVWTCQVVEILMWKCSLIWANGPLCRTVEKRVPKQYQRKESQKRIWEMMNLTELSVQKSRSKAVRTGLGKLHDGVSVQKNFKSIYDVLLFSDLSPLERRRSIALTTWGLCTEQWRGAFLEDNSWCAELTQDIAVLQIPRE